MKILLQLSIVNPQFCELALDDGASKTVYVCILYNYNMFTTCFPRL